MVWTDNFPSGRSCMDRGAKQKEVETKIVGDISIRMDKIIEVLET